MSYCVNCGVKLAKSEAKCPLCNTKVINPNKLKDDYVPAYSNKIEMIKSIDYKFTSRLILVILLTLASITVLCDLIITRNISWSIYVVCALIHLSSYLMFMVNKNIYISFGVVFITLELLLFSIAYLNNGLNWYIYLVFPFVFILFSYVLICTHIIKKRRKGLLRRFILCLLFSDIALICIESGIDLFRHNKFNYTWSLYAALPITIISFLLFILSFNRKLIEEIKQRIFI
jgi:hypothetical protein